MTSEPPPVRAPQGAVAWPITGWTYDPADIPTDAPGFRVETVANGQVPDVTTSTPAPLVAALRIDADVTKPAARVNDFYTTVVPRLATDKSLTQPRSTRSSANLRTPTR